MSDVKVVQNISLSTYVLIVIVGKALRSYEDKETLNRPQMERQNTADGEGKPLKARGHALTIGGRKSWMPDLSRPASARSDSSRLPVGTTRSRSLSPAIRTEGCRSRSPGRRSVSPASNFGKDESDKESLKSEPRFEVKKFKHYCFDDNVSMICICFNL